jgi:hypothetical protein
MSMAWQVSAAKGLLAGDELDFAEFSCQGDLGDRQEAFI